MRQLADECADKLVPNVWWYKPEIREAFIAGWRASTKNRWPKAKVISKKR